MGKLQRRRCRMFSVKRSEIQDVKDGNAPSASILNWPGSHAPFNDLNANGVYEPNIGEYPLFDPSVISNVPGEMVWWVINDVGGAHTAHPGGLPLGVEIQTTAYAYPTNATELYRYLRSYWADGQPLTYGTPDGRGGSGFTSYAFPGNLYSTTSWKETAAPGDRRILPSIGPTVLFPGAANEVIMATVWAQSDTGANRGSVAKLIRSVDTLHQIAATHFAGFSTGINLDKISVKAFPNPTTERLYIELENAYQQIEFTIYTLDGKKVKTESIENSRKPMLNVSSLLNGIYLLKINADGAERVLKFVKE